VIESTLLLRRFILALCAYREASGESYKGKILVCQVIENRVQDVRWPDNYVGVITQRLQFSSFNVNDPNAARWPKETGDAAWDECVKAADAVLQSTEKWTTANHYHTADITPAWADSNKVVAREGHHVFYEL
jgi:spore germination cell wall hydrolase CwlJ-like protein